MFSAKHAYRYGRARRAFSLLMLAALLASGLVTSFPARPVAAAGANGKAYIAYRGKMREVYRTSNGQVIFKTYNNNGTFAEVNLGFNTPAIPTFADNPGDTFISVFARGTDNALWFCSMSYDNGFSAWASLGGTFYDDPAAYTTNLGGAPVTVAVTGTDGQRYERSTTNGTSFSGWNVSEKGRYIPIGTNILSGQNLSTTGQILFDTRTVSAMDNLHPLVTRVRMFLAREGGRPRFSGSDLDALVARGVRTMIIDGSADGLDNATLQYMIRDKDIGGGSILAWAARNTNVTVYFELGNEPDREQTWSYRAGGARDTAIDTLQRWRDTSRNLPNSGGLSLQQANPTVRLMISLPTLAANSSYAAEAYFNEFVRDAGRGRIGDLFDAIAVHSYSLDCYTSSGHSGDGVAGRDPLYAIAQAKQTGGAPVYITEAAINLGAGVYANRYGLSNEREARSAELGRRYVNALNAFDLTDGRVKGVTFYQTEFTSRSDDFYSLDYNPDYTQPFHAHYAMGAGIQAADCTGK